MDFWNSIDVYSLVCGIACCTTAQVFAKLFDFLIDLIKELISLFKPKETCDNNAAISK